LICIYQVHFVSGKEECLDPEYYVTKIEPYEVILPIETFQFFKKLSLQACALADSHGRDRCEQDVQLIDDWIKEMNNLDQFIFKKDK
jgi:hypothetical protein